MTPTRPSEGSEARRNPLEALRALTGRGGPTRAEVGANLAPASAQEGIDRALSAIDQVMKGIGDIGKNLSKYFGAEDLNNLCDLMQKVGMDGRFIGILRGAEKSGAVIVRGIEKKLGSTSGKRIVRSADQAADAPHFTAIQNEVTRANRICLNGPTTGTMFASEMASQMRAGDTTVEQLVPLAKIAADKFIAEYQRRFPAPPATPGTAPAPAPTPAP
jgi:hypothetical protein